MSWNRDILNKKIKEHNDSKGYIFPNEPAIADMTKSIKHAQRWRRNYEILRCAVIGLIRFIFVCVCLVVAALALGGCASDDPDVMQGYINPGICGQVVLKAQFPGLRFRLRPAGCYS